MSRAYLMNVRISGVNEVQTIKLNELFAMVYGAENDGYLAKDNSFNVDFAYNLCSGETEDEFSCRVSKDIWETLNGYYPIDVHQGCIEYVPYEQYSMDEQEYIEIMGNKPNE